MQQHHYPPLIPVIPLRSFQIVKITTAKKILNITFFPKKIYNLSSTLMLLTLEMVHHLKVITWITLVWTDLFLNYPSMSFLSILFFFFSHLKQWIIHETHVIVDFFFVSCCSLLETPRVIVLALDRCNILRHLFFKKENIVYSRDKEKNA